MNLVIVASIISFLGLIGITYTAIDRPTTLYHLLINPNRYDDFENGFAKFCSYTKWMPILNIIVFGTLLSIGVVGLLEIATEQLFRKFCKLVKPYLSKITIG